MGYNTHFEGSFSIDRSLDDETEMLLYMLSTTRRMKRSLEKIAIKEGISTEEALTKYGLDGLFYFDKESQKYSMNSDDTVLDHNESPQGLPSLWCDWSYNKEKCCIEWNLAEKFYKYVSWIKYIIKNILAPKNYILNGKVHFQGESPNDVGDIEISDNIVVIHLETSKADDKYSKLEDGLNDLTYLLYELDESKQGYPLLKEKLQEMLNLLE